MTSDDRDEALGTPTEHGPSRIVPVADDLRVGTQLAGYRIESVVGRGGMGVVYRARHVHLGRAVAVKVLVADLVESEDFRARFLRESRTAASISHPNIITVYDAGESDGLLYIAMQYVEGADLARLLQAEGSLDPGRALALLGQVAAALDVAHAHGIVHRDVKPANVLIDGEHCYLTDFGLAKSISSQTALTARGQFVGTVHYMAPEQIKGADVDARSDVYALGCLAYHVLAGKVPFERDSEVSSVYAHLEDPPPSLIAERPNLPSDMEAPIVRALAKRKDDRQRSCGELVAALQGALDGRRAQPAEGGGRPPAAALLVVAREPHMRALVRASVKSASLAVLEAADGVGATAVAEKERPELVAIDWGADGSGAAVCRMLRERLGAPRLKILALVGSDEGAGADALREGADDYVVRPFSPLQLLYKLRDLMGADLVGT